MNGPKYSRKRPYTFLYIISFYYRKLYFDQESQENAKLDRKTDTTSEYGKPANVVKPLIAQFHSCDEQKLQSHRRMGMTDAKAEWVLKKMIDLYLFLNHLNLNYLH